jgi:ferredoxin-NADP reductase
MAFHFERPDGFEFRAGQAIDVTVLNPPETDDEGNIRTFSIASPPFEDRLMIATRMRNSACKRVLKSMPLGTDIQIDGPSGSLTLHKNSSKPAVFLAGGIGITPFLSILRQAEHEKLPHQLYLFYSNRRPEDAPFLDTLNELQKTNPNFRFVPTMTAIGKSHQKWIGQTGVIDSSMVANTVSSVQGPIYYIAGPPVMVRAMRQVIVAAGADEDDIRTEGFSGY